MYRCENCGTTVAPRTPTHQVVVRRRPKEYPTRSREVRGAGRGRRVFHQTIDKGGEGHEIVREMTVCPDCAEQPAHA